MAVTFWRIKEHGANGISLEQFCKDVEENKGEVYDFQVVQSEADHQKEVNETAKGVNKIISRKTVNTANIVAVFYHHMSGTA